MIKKTAFITFSQSRSKFNKKGNKLISNALNLGFDYAHNYSEKDIKNKFFKKKIKSYQKFNKKGYGSYAWKPYIILDAFKRFNVDCVVYHDAGRENYINYESSFFPNYILDYIEKNKLNFLLGVLVPQFGKLSNWTKRDCLILMKMDKKNVYKKFQIQATWSIWKNNQNSFNFLKQWLEFSKDERCITDKDNQLNKKNLKNFIAHRHDQSIYTLLAYKLKISKKHYYNFSNFKIYKVLIDFLNKIKNPNLISGLFLKPMDDTELLLRKKYFKIFKKYIFFYLTYKICRK